MKNLFFKKVSIVSLMIVIAALLSWTCFASTDSSDEETKTICEPNQATAKFDEKISMRGYTIYSNVFLGNDSLAGVSYEDAVKACYSQVEELKETNFLMKSRYEESYQYGGTYDCFNVQYDDSAYDKEMEQYTAKGNAIVRYKRAKDLQTAPAQVDLKITLDTDKINEYYTPLKDQWTRDPISATATVQSGEVEVIPERVGLAFNFDACLQKLATDIQYANLNHTGVLEVIPDETVTEATVKSDVFKGAALIGSWKTNYSAPSTQVLKNRQQNLINSTSKMNGHTFAPGEEISALAMYGAVTLENGYAIAGTYNNGGHVDEIGGGLCQTTTTLYNAVLAAELEVTYRRNHSYLVNYIDPSRDAMVYAANGSDFKFRNSSSGYITIESYVNTGDYSLHVNIIGQEDHAADHKVRYESEILSLSVPQNNDVVDNSFNIGWGGTKYRVEGDVMAGCVSRLWKITTDGGKETRVLFNARDSYKPMAGTVRHSPDCKITFNISGGIGNSFLLGSVEFLNGVPCGSNPGSWTTQQLIDFNNEMSSLCDLWPDHGASYSIEGVVLRNDPIPEESTESKD